MQSNDRTEGDEVLKEIELLDKRVKYILWIALPILILLPIFTTQFDWFFDFTETGEIGDTIGGLSAPVIGVVSALLIYFSFRAQINANRIIQMQINEQKRDEEAKNIFQNNMEIYKQIKESFEQFTILLDGNEFRGHRAIHLFLDTLVRYKDKDKLDGTSIYLFDNMINLMINLVIELELSKNKNVNTNIIVLLLENNFNGCIWMPFKKYIIEIINDATINGKYPRALCESLNNLNNWIESAKKVSDK